MWGKSVQLMILRAIIVINNDNQLKERNLSKRNADFFKDKPGGTIITTLHERINLLTSELLF
jgi:general stress protein 26